MAAKKEGVKAKSGLDLQRQRVAKFAALSTDVEVARRRAGKIRDGLRSWATTRDAIIEAFQKQDWFTLGYTSWDDYCDTEFSGGKLNLSDDDRRDAILAFASVGMTLREIGSAAGTSKDTAQRTLARSRVSGETKSPLVDALRGEIEAAAERTETSAASAAADTPPGPFSPGPVEPDVDLKAASTSGTQTPVDGPDMTPAGEAAASASSPSGAEIAPVPVGAADSPAAESIEPSHAGVPAAGAQTEERTEDAELIGCPLCTYAVEVSEADPDATLSEMNYHLGRTHDLAGKAAGDALGRVRTISPAADPMAPPSPQQPGQDSPTGPGVEGLPSRSETNLHLPHGGVGGEAPGEPRPPVEPELEGGGILPPPSSSDHEDTPGDQLLAAFAALVAHLGQADAAGIGPTLFDNEMSLLHEHAEDITDFMERLEGARDAQ